MIPYEFDAERFSRWMAYVLRHNPGRYGLTPDRNGYVDFGEFLLIARRRYPSVTLERLKELIEAGGSGRFEVAGQRLRARYGHSIPVEPAGEPVAPPARLYHAASASRAEAILAEGLKPTDRQLLHLSETAEDALAVARRKTDQPALFSVQAQEAHRAGLVFYREGKVFLVAQISPHFLSREPLPVPASPGTGGSSPTGVPPGSTPA